MSETTGRKLASTRFKPGASGNPKGRPLGSKHKLGSEFLQQFSADVIEHGAGVIERVRREKPEVYMRIWADLLPKDVNLSLTIDPVEFGNRYNAALAMLDNLPEPRQVRKAMRTIAPKIIEHDDGN